MVKKYCIVPLCANSSVKTPQKLFFSVPTDNEMRKMWLKAMRRADPIKPLSHLHCCEDHFDIENDMENYIKYQLVGGPLKLRRNVVPHKFACQKQLNKVKEPLAVQKRRKIEIINEILTDELPSTSNNVEEILIDPSAPHTTVNEDPLESLETNYEIDI